MKYIATKCCCGAITIEDKEGTFSNSMTKKTFEKEFNDTEIEFEEGEYSNCNHCVNHWGIDICGCGSGEKVGECKEGLYECKNNIASQIKFQRNKSIIEVIKKRGHF